MTQPVDPQDPNQPTPQSGQQPAQPGQPTPPPPGQPMAPPPGQPTQPNDPGKTLGIVGLVLAFFCAVVGLVISIVGFVKSRKAGFTNIPAIIGIVVGILATIGWSFGGVAVGSLAAKCAELGPGVHQEGGATITCN